MLFWILFRHMMGALFGLLTLRAMDEGLWDDALLKGAMAPPPTAPERFKFIFLCAIVPELPLAGLIVAWLHKGDR
jgi:hypothetical protein